MATSYAFRITGIEPKDRAFATAGTALQREFWRAVVPLVLAAYGDQLEDGIGADGSALIEIAASTRKYRRSARGSADPDAPPLIPAHAASRTRSLLTGRAFSTYAEFFWRIDSTTGLHWGKVLGWHRTGSKRYPPRDVIGLAPQYQAKVQAQAAGWWSVRKRALIEAARARAGILPPPARRMKVVSTAR